jgi:hypothetical protein
MIPYEVKGGQFYIAFDFSLRNDGKAVHTDGKFKIDMEVNKEYLLKENQHIFQNRYVGDII